MHIIEKTKTGSIAVDMISACLAHNKKFNKPVKSISLSLKYWNSFERYAKTNRPDFEFTNEVVFKNVTLKKGSAFQTEHLLIEHFDKLN